MSPVDRASSGHEILSSAAKGDLNYRVRFVNFVYIETKPILLSEFSLCEL